MPFSFRVSNTQTQDKSDLFTSTAATSNNTKVYAIKYMPIFTLFDQLKHKKAVLTKTKCVFKARHSQKHLFLQFSMSAPTLPF